MIVIADTHVHIYPCYNLRSLFDRASYNLERLQINYTKIPSGVRSTIVDLPTKVIFLTERYDCRAFENLQNNEHPAENLVVRETPERGVLELYDPLLKEGLFVVAGRQIVTKERLEMLSLASEQYIEDGLPVREVLERIDEAGGVPVLNWSPGKWLFKRGLIVRDLLKEYSSEKFLIGDVSLRPLAWGEPYLMKKSGKRGFKRVAGTDPLPFSGEEVKVGQYGVAISEGYDKNRPLSSLRALLRDPASPITVLGKRDPMKEVYRRLQKNSEARKKAKNDGELAC